MTNHRPMEIVLLVLLRHGEASSGSDFGGRLEVGTRALAWCGWYGFPAAAGRGAAGVVVREFRVMEELAWKIYGRGYHA